MMRQAKLGFTKTSSSSFRGGSINSPVDICSTATLLRVCVRAAGRCESSSLRHGIHEPTRRHSPPSPTAHRPLSTASPLPISERWWWRMRAACGLSPWSTARWRMKPAFRRLRRSGPRSARPRCCYGFAASSVPAGKLPPRSRAMASLPTGSASLRRGRRSRTSIRGRGGARFVRCSAWRTWCRSRVTACLSRR